MAKFNYILNDLALINLVTRNLYSKNVCREDKEELENQIKLIMQENKQLKDNWNKLKEYIYNQIPTDKTVLTKHIKIFEVLNKMQELEGSDNK